jgi:hypothetical protein
MTKGVPQVSGHASLSMGGLDEVRILGPGADPGFISDVPLGKALAWTGGLPPTSGWLLVIPRPKKSAVLRWARRGQATENP